jgi:hypothetical protein
MGCVTAYEIKLACENLEDLNELYGELGMEKVDSGLMADGCDPELPSVEELKVWTSGITHSQSPLSLAASTLEPSRSRSASIKLGSLTIESTMFSSARFITSVHAPVQPPKTSFS